MINEKQVDYYAILKHCVDDTIHPGYTRYTNDEVAIFVGNTARSEDVISLKASTKDAGAIEITIAVGVSTNWNIATITPPRLCCRFTTLHIMVPFLESLIETQKKNPNRVSSLEMLEYLVTVISDICVLAKNT